MANEVKVPAQVEFVRVPIRDEAEDNNRRPVPNVLWKVCCFEMDRDAVLLFVQVKFCLLAFLLCGYVIVFLPNSPHINWALSTIMLILGIFTNTQTMQRFKTLGK